ncbi:FmdB family zinc ribbon protein [Amycolatopsis sp. PS_44_ISF1]|uniref:FmdB family zinc ribbon protein n=1 Tax=Amycolatopsis sp. PS_44_ISF1 TaxID=2974917 RepID=UPI0028DE9D87|nr:FmdB family zinc ribbon protein [Amycolatopsis sp. PS_44_ISF1]MDT8911306.1 FmdB family transcriptional regulator [Amycolatopsis sp. PS_44_ISF1]
MPTYQYACKECDHRFEAVQSFSDASLTVCPQCSGPLRKVFSSVGVVFKGSGFYRNDSRDAAKSSTSATPAKSESKSETKTESKSDAKSSSSSSSSDSGSSSSSSSSGTTKTTAAAS